jgi:type IV secretory pathway TraG/TraD family ATPase VirD4
MKKVHPLEAMRDRTSAVAASLIISMIAFVGAWTLAHLLAPPVVWSPATDGPVVLDIGELTARLGVTWRNGPEIESLWSAVQAVGYMATHTYAALMTWHFAVPCAAFLITAVMAARISGRIVYRAVKKGLVPVRRVTTTLGQEPRFGGFGARHITETWHDRLMEVGSGVFLAPGVAMPRDVEPEHVAVLGTTGAGKSTIVNGILVQGARRGDRCLIIDVKGDGRRRYGLTEAGEIGLGDTGGLVWAIGDDIRTRQDAIELAAVLIPASRDPIWSDGARLYLVGLIVALQQQSGTKWGWKELREVLAKPFEEQESLIRTAMPDVVHLLKAKDGDPTATVMSIMVTVVANVGSIAWTLAQREAAGGATISLRAWAAGEAAPRVIFLRLEFDRETQSAALLKLALRCVQATLLGATVSDGVDHAIWFGLDELPRFCADDETVERLVALGRSRGVRIIAALQVPAQLRRVLSADATNSLLGNFGIQIVSRVAPGPSRVEIARDWFGTRTVTWNPALTGGDATKEWPLKEIPVLSEAELTGCLGKFYSTSGRPFIRAAVTGFEHLPILDWPIGWADRL